MIVLGIHAFAPDAAAALVIDGRVAVAVEEERLSRVKHQGGFPAGAVQACLAIAGVRVEDVDVLAVARRPEANLTGEILCAVAGRSSYPPALREAYEDAARAIDWRGHLARATACAPDDLRCAVEPVERALAHAALAYYPTPFDDAAILVVDGVGDFCTTLLARGRGRAIEPLEKVLFPHSLGLFVAMVAQLLGFQPFGDESRIMGLAATGSDRFLDAMRAIVHPPRGDPASHRANARHAPVALDLSYFTHATQGDPVRLLGAALPLHAPDPRLLAHPRPLYSARAVERFGPPRRPGAPIGPRERDLAFACQRVLEERVCEIAARLRGATGCEDLAFTGKIAANPLITAALRRSGLFRRVAVPASPIDSGAAIGAALHAAIARGAPREAAAPIAARSDLGPAFEREHIRTALAARGIPFDEPRDLIADTADALARGEIVGWFAGRAEFGPRALGRRSILADPRPQGALSRGDSRAPTTADRLRDALPHREPFRSFGVSVPREDAASLFFDTAPSPFMLDAFRAHPEAAERLPAVVHADGVVRVHTVDREIDPTLHALLRAFAARTGVPALLDTSLNANEPIVCTPEEAIACARAARLDRLVLEGIVARPR